MHRSSPTSNFLLVCGATAGLLLFGLNAHAARFLFDAAHGQSAGNADWVIDADQRNIDWNSSGGFNHSGNESNAQRVPAPTAAGITDTTAETYWNGAISAWAVDLVKRGHTVESLPAGSNFVYGTAIAQDLTNYDVVVIDEPNTSFRSGEKQALMNFVAAGGGLFMITDHTGSDRNGDGVDSVDVWRDFLTNNGVSNNAFGITLPAVEDYDGTSSSSTRRTAPDDPIIFGPVGTVSKVQFFGGLRFAINSNQNASVLAHIWFGSAAGDRTNHVALASLRYGLGRVVLYGDSSAPDDGTGDPNDINIINGYTQNGVQHRFFILNASEWLATAATNAVLDSAFIAITNPATSGLLVSNNQASIDISGVASNVSGLLTWSNALTGAWGTAPATTSWMVSAVTLDVGVNELSVSATNSAGSLSADGISVTRASLGTPPQMDLLSDVSAQESQTVHFAVTAQATEGDPISLTASNLPLDSSFGATNGTGYFSWTNAGPVGTYVPVFYAVDKDGVSVTSLVITITNYIPMVQGPCVSTNLLFENFDSTNTIPQGWTATNSANDTTNIHYRSAPNCRTLPANSVIITPPVNGPTQLLFYVDSSSAGNTKTGSVEYAIADGPWVSLRTFVVSTAGFVLTNDLTTAPNLTGVNQVRFRFSSTFATWYLDDVIVRGATCNEPSGYAQWAAQITNGLTGYADSALGDGVPNLLKYATGSSITNVDDLFLLSLQQSNGFTALQFNRNTNANDITLIVENSTLADDDAPWQGLATNYAGTWIPSGLVTEAGTSNPVVVRVPTLVPAETNCFLRIRVTLP